MGTLGWRKGTLEERLLAGLNKNGPIPTHRPDLGPCWIWTKAKNDRGYGQLSVVTSPGIVVRRYTHIISYELYVGPIPDGFELDHLCRTPACANYVHLEAVTHKENMNRGRSATKEFCAMGHLRTPENNYIRPDGTGKMCKVCQKDRQIAFCKSGENARRLREHRHTLRVKQRKDITSVVSALDDL